MPPQPAVQGSKPNFLERMLPTAGGILGGIGGEALNIFGGGVVGASAGSALGKALENKFTGQAGGNGVGTSALEGGVGQAGGQLLGAAGKGIMGKLGGLADTGATKLIQGQFAKGSLDADTASTLNNMGVTNAKQVADLYPHTSALNGGVQRGFEEAGTSADLSNLSNAGRNLVSANQMQLSNSAGSIPEISKTIESALLNAVNPEDISQVSSRVGRNPANVFAPGALSNVLPENALKVTQNFEALASKAYQGAYDKMGNVNPDQLAKYNIFKGMAEESRKAAFGGDTPIPLSDANKAQIISDLGPMKDVSPSAYNWHINQVSNAKNLQDLRPIQAPLVRASHALNATTKMAGNSGGLSAGDVVKMGAPLAGSIAGGPLGMAGGLAVSALGSKAADKVGASTLSKVADLLTNPTMQKAVSASATPATQIIANSPNDVPQGGGMQPTTSPQLGAGGAQPGVPPQPTPVEQLFSQLLNNLQTAQGNPAMTGAPQFASSDVSALNTLAPYLQKADVAKTALQSLMQEFPQAGGGQGLGGGLLNTVGQTLSGGPGSLLGGGYNSQAEQLNHQLQGLGVSVPLPSLMLNGQGANAGFSTLQNILQTMGGGGTLGTVPTGGV